MSNTGFSTSSLCAKGGNILTFLKILLFGASIQLTSSPVDINTTLLKLEAPEPLDVVTTGAHLLIDITKNVKSGDLLEARNDARSKLPEGCVKAILISKDNQAYKFSNQGVSWSQGEVQLSLISKGALETDLEFVFVELSSCKAIRGTRITWVNYKH
jgi:hypothetical protein